VSGCPLIPRTLTLRYSNAQHGFKGKLSASTEGCFSGREVTVFKRVHGPDKNRGTTTTDASGAYLLAKSRSAGKYYATSARFVVAGVGECAAVTSPTLTLS
jgi:hypothetical protein